jgi:RNA polymerase sigma-70 factor (ECF subfamily)
MRAEERRLLERVRTGDRSVFADLYRDHAARVYGFALRRLGDANEAEDVRQDVFVEVMRSIGTFEGRSSMGTWILAIANHEVASRRRRRDREPALVDAGIGLEQALRVEGRLDRRVDARRVLGRCAEVLRAELGASSREVFELHVRGARDIATIARAVGRTGIAVRISLMRTRRRLTARVAGLRELLSA